MTRGPVTLERLSLATGVLTCVVALVVFSTTLVFIYEGRVEGPYSDFWYFVKQLHRLHDGRGDWWSEWTRPFNAHQIAIPRLFFWAEVELFSTRNVFLVAASCLFQLVTPLLFLICISQVQPRLATPTRLFLCGTAFALPFAATQLQNFLTPWHMAFLACFAFASLSFFAMTQVRSFTGTTYGRALLGLSVVAAVTASYSMGAGLLTWPILLAMAALVRLGARALLMVGVTGVLVITTYLGASSAGSGVNTAAVNSSTLLWILACLGSPLSIQNLTAGQGLAAGGLLLAAWNVVGVALRPKAQSPATLLASALIVFAVGATFLTGIGRAQGWPDMWGAARYNTATLLFWLSLIVLVSLRADETDRAASATRLVVQSVVLLWLVAVLLPAHFANGIRLVGKMERVRGANVALLMDVRARREYRQILTPGLARQPRDAIQPLRNLLEEKGIGIFSYGHHRLLGTPIRNAHRTADPSSCAGTLERRSAAGDMVRLDGRVKNRKSTAPVEFIFVTDEAETIRGIGRTTERRSPFLHLGRPRGAGLAWRAYVPTAEAEGMQIWALLPDGAVCPFGRG